MSKLVELIAVGFTAEIYAWRDGWVLKLFNLGRSRRSVEYEAALSRMVHSSGLPVPAVGEVVEVDGRFGLELERLDGKSMLEVLTGEPDEYTGYAQRLAELQAEMHTRRLPELPSQRDRLRGKIMDGKKLTEEVRTAALEALQGIPEDDKLCHGDFHPGNILLTQRGAMIIDWVDATRGSPLLDVARSTLIFGGVHLPPEFPGAEQLNMLLPGFYEAYRKRYFEINPLDQKELERWLPMMAAARLDENILFDEERLMSIAMRLVTR